MWLSICEFYNLLLEHSEVHRIEMSNLIQLKNLKIYVWGFMNIGFKHHKRASEERLKKKLILQVKHCSYFMLIHGLLFVFPF